jgi:L,D-peptidoglycan transpeptidase YkuD (ErfK/YbiS/YcfS/YnhG family)
MKRTDELYEFGAVIEYNTDPVVPGHGSAIFLHVWSGPQSSTAGCVALAKDDVRRLLRWLDRNKNPVIALNQR